MYLKSIEIQGFKSFPDRTVIAFHPGMTAIVGPNGSGKSNVTDAIRWVLGEQSVKTLRGRKMEDIIFSGTQSRRPMSYAEVTILFDNQAGKLPLEYREVAVTRRLYRSGESEYLLNQVPCRLRDIIELFLDTGVGRDGYSIVGQGRVDELLSPRSEDRRRVFEEASGIAKLRVKKEETERRLHQTEQHLERAEDILRELLDRLGPLEGQAATARKYLTYRDELKTRDCILSCRQIAQITKQRDQLVTLHTDTLKEKQEASEKEAAAEQAYQTLLSSAGELEQRAEALQARQAETSQRELDFVARQTQRDQQEESARTRLALLADREAGDRDRLRSLEEELNQRQERADLLAREEETLEGEVKALEAELESKTKACEDREAEYEALNQELTNRQDQFYEEQTRSARLQAELRALEGQEKQEEEEHKRQQTLLDQLSLDAEDAKREQEHSRKMLAISREHAEEEQRDLDEAKALCEQLDKEQENLRREEEQLNYRLQTLTALEKSYEGYTAPVQALLGKSGGLTEVERSGIQGTVAELIRVPKRYETAMEIALGASQQHIVVDTDKTAARLIQHLKDKHLGRATFLPLANLRAKPPAEPLVRKASNCEGYLGPADSFVSAPGLEKGSTLLQYLLGGFILVDTLDNARYIARETEHKLRLVTLEGELLSPGGAMTGGSLRSQRVKLLSRTREIEEARKRLTALPKLREELKEKLGLAREELLRCGEACASRGEEQARWEKEAIRKETVYLQLAKQWEQVKNQEEIWRKDADARNARRESCRQEELEAQKAVEACREAIRELSDQLKDKGTDSRESREERDKLREALSAHKLQWHTLRENRKSACEWAEKLRADREEHLQAVARGSEEEARLREQLETLQKQVELLQSEKEILEQEKLTWQKDMEALAADRSSREAERETLLAELRRHAEQRARLESELDRLEAQQEKQETQEDQLRAALWENYETTYEQLCDAGVPAQDTETAQSQLQRRIGELKQLIRQLGPVNPQAVEEYEQLRERTDFLTAQRDDIVAARKNLGGIIDSLTESMRERFSESLTRINENFGEVFTSLFGGGQAEITLGEHEDVLLAPIEIKASPPGKRLQNMLLLSGGERSLTAIALLFAILNLRPTPFVVLDEIEAALDDANVLRFTDYVRDHAARSQFILVTHRKGTMEACDRIYGVTMQERGVSRILSMQLTDDGGETE